MKSTFKKIIVLLLSLLISMSFACSNATDEIDIYMPDGAPALSMARLMHADDIEGVSYHVVDPTTITATVTGGEPKADVCILPINNATKLLGSGDMYKLIGTVTHGNLYLVSTLDTTITVDNLSSLVGERVGVIKLGAVPGLTFKAILHDKSIPYTEVSNGDSIDRDAINLQNIDTSQVGLLEGVNYYLLAEPAVTVKCSIPSLNLRVVGSIQDLYGEGGYPQAVIIAKNALLTSSHSRQVLLDIVNSINTDLAWTKDNISLSAQAIASHLPLDYTPTIKAQVLTSASIDRCHILYTPADRHTLNGFLIKLNAVSSTSWGEVSEDFIYAL